MNVKEINDILDKGVDKVDAGYNVHKVFDEMREHLIGDKQNE